MPSQKARISSTDRAPRSLPARHPVPWDILDIGEIVDADGERVATFDYNSDAECVLWERIVASVNLEVQALDLVKRLCRLFGGVDPDELTLNSKYHWETAPDTYVRFWHDVLAFLKLQAPRA